jgi:hypothetical protein
MNKKYEHDNGLIYMCAYCKQVKDPVTLTYSKVPDLVLNYLTEHHIKVSHGICHPCLDNWFKEEGIDVSLETILEESKHEQHN